MKLKTFPHAVENTLKKHRPIQIAGMITVLALLARVIGLDKGVWIDEALSLFYAYSGFFEFIQKLSEDNSAPLYYLLLKGWINLFGASEISIRIPSVMATIGGLIIIYRYLKKINRTSAIAGIVLIAVSPVSIYYSQEARNYALLFLLIAAYIYFYSGFISSDQGIYKSEKTVAENFRIRAEYRMPGQAGQDTVFQPVLQFPGTWLNFYWAGLILSAALICLTHNIGFFFIAGMQISFVLITSPKLKKLWLWGHLLWLVLIFPWLFFLLKQTREISNLSWFIPLWKSQSPLSHLYDTISIFCVGPYPPYMAIHGFSHTLARSLSVLLVITAFFGFVRFRKNIALKGLWLGSLTTLTMLLCFSIFHTPIYIPGRSDYLFYPAYILFVSLGISTFKSKYPAPVITTVVLVASLLVLVPYYGDDTKNATKKYISTIAGGLQRGDIIISTGLTYLDAKYYLDRLDLDLKIVTFPEFTKTHPIGFYDKTRYKNELLTGNAHQLLPLITEGVKRQKRVYLLLTPDRINNILLDELSGKLSYTKIHSTNFYQSLIGTSLVVLALEEKEDIQKKVNKKDRRDENGKEEKP